MHFNQFKKGKGCGSVYYAFFQLNKQKNTDLFPHPLLPIDSVKHLFLSIDGVQGF